MTDASMLLLRDLHEGRTSRNRHFERFEDGAGRRALRGYRRVRSLLAELRRAGTEARVSASRASGDRAVEVLLQGLRYRRVVLLTPAEFELLSAELGPAAPVAEGG